MAFIIHPHPDGYKVTWPGYSHAFALFTRVGTGIHISDIFRDPNQTKGTAGIMLAEVIRHIGLQRPTYARMVNVLKNQPTISQINQGQSPETTILGKVIHDLAKALGTEVIGWRRGIERDKFWIEGTFKT